eukprot:14441447-Ditylum_brightwellii.AAC.1
MDKETMSTKSGCLPSFDVMAKRINSDLPSIEDTTIAVTNTTVAAAAKIAKKVHTIAIASFTMDFTSESLIGMMHMAMTMD